MKQQSNNDIMGMALLDYQHDNFTENIMTYSSLGGNDEMDIPFLFRTIDEMPIIEQKAMEICQGTVLDIGCGAGSHALYLQNKNMDVKAIDISKGAIETCKLRGIKNAVVQNIWDIKQEKFDTLLLVMNGIGLCKTLDHLPAFLDHLKSLLNPKGQIVLDSSDLIYLYDEKIREKISLESNKYYGEVTFEMVYNGQFSDLIHWLFPDYKTLETCAKNSGFNCELILEGYHDDFLVKLTSLK